MFYMLIRHEMTLFLISGVSCRSAKGNGFTHSHKGDLFVSFCYYQDNEARFYLFLHTE